MVAAELVLGDILLLRGIIFCIQNIVAEPLVATCGGKHAAHQVETAVGMGEGMQSIVRTNAELFGRDKDRAAGTQ